MLPSDWNEDKRRWVEAEKAARVIQASSLRDALGPLGPKPIQLTWEDRKLLSGMKITWDGCGGK